MAATSPLNKRVSIRVEASTQPPVSVEVHPRDTVADVLSRGGFPPNLFLQSTRGALAADEPLFEQVEDGAALSASPKYDAGRSAGHERAR